MLRTVYTIIILICLSFTFHLAQAKKYIKIMNPDGTIDYKDHIPADQNNSSRTKLNHQGLKVNSIGEALSKTEIKKLMDQEKEAVRLKREQLWQAKQDKKLIDAYPSIEALILARDNNISSFQAKIKLASSNIQKLQEALLERERNAANIELSGKKIPEREIKAIKKINDSILNNEYAIQEYRTQQNNIRTQFTKNLRTLQRILREFAEKKSRRRSH